MVNSQFEALSATHCELVALETDPFDTVWLDRPAAPAASSAKCPLRSAAKAVRRNAHGSSSNLLSIRLTFWQSPCPITSPAAQCARFRSQYGSGAFSFALLHRSGELEWFVDANKTQQLPEALLNALTISPQEDFLSRCQQLAHGKRFPSIKTMHQLHCDSPLNSTAANSSGHPIP